MRFRRPVINFIIRHSGIFGQRALGGSGGGAAPRNLGVAERTDALFKVITRQTICGEHTASHEIAPQK